MDEISSTPQSRSDMVTEIPNMGNEHYIMYRTSPIKPENYLQNLFY